MTTPHYADEDLALYLGDCLDVMRTLPDDSVDAVVTDPPYGLGFMGREWDALPPGREWAEQCLRLLKPGGHMLAFGGTRTWHRLACAVEDAGFEIRDSIAWLYAQGFPKSLDVSKAIDKSAGAERKVIGRGNGGLHHRAEVTNLSNWNTDHDADGHAITAPATDAAREWQGWGTALKPAFEPVVCARKPLAGTVAANVQTWGTGALNINGCRIATDDDTARTPSLVGDTSAPFGRGAAMGGSGNPAGRWPANVVLDETQAAELDRQSGVLTSGSRAAGRHGLMGYMGAGEADMPAVAGDTGGASRFFYVAKAGTAERPKLDGTGHPTVKPVDLMRWLVRLVTPPGGTVLEPFLGSGTTAEACIAEGFRCIGIERDEAYMRLVEARLSKPIQRGMFG